jgi:hypothetical protein
VKDKLRYARNGSEGLEAMLVIVGVSVILLFSGESIEETDMVAVSPYVVVSVFVELVMPIPAATNPPIPLAMEVLLETGSVFTFVRVEALISPLEPLTPDDVVLLLFVLPSAEHGVATRHRTRTRRPANTEEMVIVEKIC